MQRTRRCTRRGGEVDEESSFKFRHLIFEVWDTTAFGRNG